MTIGTLFGIGVGPGDPDLITVKAAKILAGCEYVLAPQPSKGAESLALRIAAPHLSPTASIQTLVFPMTRDRKALAKHWKEAAAKVAGELHQGRDACFLTLGDPLLYSTYIYLLSALEELDPQLRTTTIPGITAFSAVAALTQFPVGEAKEPVTIVPTDDDLKTLIRALEHPGTVVVMKIGKRLPAILELLAQRKLLPHGVLVSRAGQPAERIERNLDSLRSSSPEIGYLSTMLVRVPREEAR
jgi:precorrin-2/cobalt-factor-2 C20-methyltransferase